MKPSIYRNHTEESVDRGQTGIDFLVGMSIFLMAVGFVFLFLPTLFDPFIATGTSNSLVSDRTAAYLAEEALVDPEHPNVLNETKVATFFIDDCDSDSIDDLLGVSLRQVNVTLEQANSVEFACGPAHPTTASVTVSQRIVTASDGESRTVHVRVW